MKIVTIKFSDVDGVLGDFDKTYQEYKYVRKLVNTLNDCIINTSYDHKRIETLNMEEVKKMGRSLVSTLREIISDQNNSRRLLDMKVIGGYIKEDNDIVKYVLSRLDEYKGNIDKSWEILIECEYKYDDIWDILVGKRNYLFGIAQRLERYKDYSLYDVIAAVCDVYEEPIIPSTRFLGNARSNISKLFKFVVWLRNLLLDYSNSLEFSTYADYVTMEEK